MTQPDDATLVNMSREGSQAAFAALVRRHWERARRVVAALLSNPADVEDVLQEAFLQAYLRLDTLRDPARFRPWVCGIALNLARMQLRTGARQLFAWETLEQLGALWHDAGRPPEKAVEQRDLNRRLWQAIAGLPPAEQEALLRVYRDGLSHKETAALSGASLSAIKVRVHRGRRRLRATLPPEFAPVSHKEMTMIGVEIHDVLAFWPELETEALLAPLAEKLPAGKRQELFAAVTFSLIGKGGPHGLWTLSQSLTEGMAEEERQAFLAEWQRLMPHRIVLLKELDGERALPIWIGPFEAELIVMKLANYTTVRPLTHDLTTTLLELASVRIESVAVNRLENDIFYGTLSVHTGNGEDVAEVDCRPSDALGLAVRLGVPIFVAPDVMESQGIRPDTTARYPAGERLGQEPTHSLLYR